MKKFPEGLTAYRKTDTFDIKTVPSRILKDHTSKVWAKIIVVEGVLNYMIQGPQIEKIQLDATRHGVVEPDVKHYVELNDQSKFYVEFYE